MSNDPPALSRDVGAAFFDRFQVLTAIQSAAIPRILGGSDAVLVSGTGTGKTEAVVAPLVQRHVASRARSAYPALLYVVPTKALANDVRRRLAPRFSRLGLRLGIRHGDETAGLQGEGCDLLLTTPESLDVLATRRDDCLGQIRAVVVDEAHLLFNTQRGMQLAILLRRLEQRTAQALQVCCMSATIADGKELWRFFRPTSGPSDVSFLQGSTSKPIAAAVRIATTQDDFLALIDRIGRDGDRKGLVFANSRKECDDIADLLRDRTSFGGNVFVHYSSVSPERRQQTEKSFLEGRRALCVATSTLELGIDIGDIDLVVLHGLPPTCEAFLQRMGRGSRRAETTQLLCSVPWQDPRPLFTAICFLAMLGMARSGDFGVQPVARIYGAVVQQLLSMLHERRGRFTRLADLADAVSPWDHLSRGVVDEIADSLVAQNVCQKHGFKNQICAGDLFWRMEALRLLWGNFPAGSREIPICAKGQEVGNIPAANAHRLANGTILRFAGHRWRVQRVTPSRIDVEPAPKGNKAVDVSYHASTPGLDPLVLDAARRMIASGGGDLTSLSEKDRQPVSELMSRLRPFLADSLLPVYVGNACRIYVTFAGRVMNRVLLNWAGQGDGLADDVAVVTSMPLAFERLPASVEAFRAAVLAMPRDVRDLTPFQSLLPGRLLDDETVGEWFRQPLFGSTLVRLRAAREATLGVGDLNALGFRLFD